MLPKCGIIVGMTINGLIEPGPEMRAWWSQNCSKAGKAVPRATRVKAARKSAERIWKTRRKRYGKTGHAKPYERKAA